MQFQLGTEFSNHLTGLVKMVAAVGDDYITLRQPDGWWEPGGKLEKGEDYLTTIKREMLEETGMRVVTFALFGAFHCHSLEDKPPKPGLLWPEFFFLWGYGEVERAGRPHPTATEKILQVALAPLEEICERFEQTPGAGHLLQDLYRMADTMRREHQKTKR